jgi:hypothetical protein
MATDSAGLSDEIQVELNPTGPDPDYGPQPDPIPDRPADTATKAKWAAYVVALGTHPDTAAGMERKDLIDLAGRLGG